MPNPSSSPLMQVRNPRRTIEADVRAALQTLLARKQPDQQRPAPKSFSDVRVDAHAASVPFLARRAEEGKDLFRATTGQTRAEPGANTGVASAGALERAQLLGAVLGEKSPGQDLAARAVRSVQLMSIGSEPGFRQRGLAPSVAESERRAGPRRRLAASSKLGAAPGGSIANSVPVLLDRAAQAPGARTRARPSDSDAPDEVFEWIDLPHGSTRSGWSRINTTSSGDEWVLDPNREGSEDFNGFVAVPRPRGALRVLNDNTPGFHRYHYEDELPGAERLPEWVLRAILRRNVAPNELLKPASRRGANNDAAFPLPFNQVTSYERTSNTGQYWVVNTTRSLGGRGSGEAFEPGLHVLSHGWVASTIRRNPDGTLSLLTYGEGNSPIQDPDTDLGRNVGNPVNDYVWEMRADHMRRDIESAVRGGPRHWERYRRPPRPDIRRDENGNFILR